MIANFWLRVQAKKTRYAHSPFAAGKIETFKKKPQTAANEVAVNIQFEIPDAFFQTPQLKATVKIPDDAVNRTEISASVCDNFAEALSEQLGVQVHLSVSGDSE